MSLKRSAALPGGKGKNRPIGKANSKLAQPRRPGNPVDRRTVGKKRR